MAFTFHGIRKKSGTREIGGKRSYTVVYKLTSNNGDDGPLAARTATGIPNILAFYNVGSEQDIGAYLTNKDTESVTEGDHTDWNVTCTWNVLPRDEKKKLQHPLDRPYEIDFGFEFFEEVVEKDINDVAVLNAAGDYFDPPIMRDHHRSILRIVRNESTFSGALAQLYVNTINQGAFLGGAAKTVKCATISAKRIIEEWGAEGSETEIEYWAVTYEFHYYNRTWIKKILNQGRYQRDNTPCTDADGEPVTDPVPLDAGGMQIARTSLPGAAVFREFDVYEIRDFGAFNF